MNKSSTKLLVTLALAATAVIGGWTHAVSGPRSAPNADLASVSSVSRPPMGLHNGEPDPGEAPIPRMVATRYDVGVYSHWRWASRIWAIWYLRTVD